MIAQLAAIVLPIFICVGLGILWAKIGTSFDSSLITSLVYNVGAPCLILATFHKIDLAPSALAGTALAALACYAAFAALAAAVVRAARLDAPSYLPSLIFPLTGSMGLPVCFFALGDEGLALAIVYFTIGAIGTFTVGVAIAEGSLSLRNLAGSPVLYSVAVAVVLQLLELRLPQWIFNTADLLGGMVIPAQLVALGVSLLELRTGGALARSAALGLFRLATGLAVGIAVAALFGLQGTARAVVVIQSAMPVAVSSYLFAQRFNRKPEEVAGMIVVSTAVSFATVPILLWFLLPR